MSQRYLVLVQGPSFLPRWGHPHLLASLTRLCHASLPSLPHHFLPETRAPTSGTGASGGDSCEEAGRPRATQAHDRKRCGRGDVGEGRAVSGVCGVPWSLRRAAEKLPVFFLSEAAGDLLLLPLVLSQRISALLTHFLPLLLLGFTFSSPVSGVTMFVHLVLLCNFYSYRYLIVSFSDVLATSHRL